LLSPFSFPPNRNSSVRPPGPFVRGYSLLTSDAFSTLAIQSWVNFLRSIINAHPPFCHLPLAHLTVPYVTFLSCGCFFAYPRNPFCGTPAVPLPPPPRSSRNELTKILCLPRPFIPQDFFSSETFKRFFLFSLAFSR